MAHLKLRWRKLSNSKYDIYRSDTPGSDYVLIDSIEPSNSEVEEYEIDKKIEISNLDASGLHHTIELTWNEANAGSPETYKVVPYDDSPTPQPTFTPTKDIVWMQDFLPSGAIWIDQTGAEWDSHHYDGEVSLKIKAIDGYVYPQFDSSLVKIDTKYIVTWVYIDPENVPDSIMISLYDGDWNHRVYWGKDLFPFGVEGTTSMYYMGTIPTPKCWTPLIIDTELLGATDITGVGFGVYKEPIDGGEPQTGIVYFDSIYISNERIHSTEQQHIPVDKYIVYRKRSDEDSYTKIAEVDQNRYTDENAPDIFGFASEGYRPNYSLQPHDDGSKIKITWTVPSGIGTQYNYKLDIRDRVGDLYDPYFIFASVSTEHSYIVIRGGVSSDYNSLPILSTEFGSEFTHSNLEPNTTYYYRLESYNQYDELTSRFDTQMRIKPGSLLDFFILDHSSLA